MHLQRLASYEDIRAHPSRNGSSQGTGQAHWTASYLSEASGPNSRANRGRRDALCRRHSTRHRPAHSSQNLVTLHRVDTRRAVLRPAEASQLRALNRLHAEARDLAIGIDASEINGPVWSASGRGTTGALRSSRTDRGAQVLPPAGATVPPWLPAKSARVSNLPACCALGPPACAAPCSCHHETCSARSAWPHPGKACLSV